MSFPDIVVISGKGGTGKTFVTASLIPYMSEPVIADCDVDAPDLKILLKPKNTGTEPFTGGYKAFIDPEKCTQCGACLGHCRFEAIDDNLTVRSSFCEGCGVCQQVCPADAVTLKQEQAGTLFLGETAYGPMVHAELYPGEETSGRLVTLVRKRSGETAEKEGRKSRITDGSPGIGCQVIASLTGAGKVVLVTEPSASGLHDLKRVHQLIRSFDLPASVVINKGDLDSAMRGEIASYLAKEGLEEPLVIPYNREVKEAVRQCLMPSVALEGWMKEIGFKDFAASLTKT